MFWFAVVEDNFHIISQILLVYFFVERTTLTIDDLLSFLIEIFDFVSDTIMNTFIEYSKNIVLFPHIDMDVFEIFFIPE